MPNIIAQSQSPAGISITLPKGVTFVVSAAQFLARHNLETGSVATKKGKVLTWMRGQFALLNSEYLDPANITIDYDPATGAPTLLRIDG